MAAKFSISITGAKRLSAKMRRLQAGVPTGIFSKMLMTEIGLYIMTRIKVRTAKGVDAKGKPFKPYSAGYKLFREKHQHPSNIVNLTFTGSMLNSMTFDADNMKVDVFFQNTQSAPGAARDSEKAFYLQKDRRFFALSVEDTKQIESIIRKEIRRILR
jgi:hypothetical protein